MLRTYVLNLDEKHFNKEFQMFLIYLYMVEG